MSACCAGANDLNHSILQYRARVHFYPVSSENGNAGPIKPLPALQVITSDDIMQGEQIHQ
jgi:hypothetical protein